jgi:uncharacterized protein (DUF1786 family)
MAKTTPFTIGAEASCTDGACGKVTRVVVDPIARAITHLVVEPGPRHGIGRLVPVGLVDAAHHHHTKMHKRPLASWRWPIT